MIQLAIHKTKSYSFNWPPIKLQKTVWRKLPIKLTNKKLTYKRPKNYVAIRPE
jgi:hypothetical protein